MGLSRRNALIGIGTLIAGGGAVLGTGAFTTVQAQRTVSVETAGDASAFLGLAPAETDNGDQYATTTDSDRVQIIIGGGDNQDNALNQKAITTIRNIVTVSNNGAEDVGALKLQFTTTPDTVDPDQTFDFLVGSSASFDHSSSGDGVNILSGDNVPDTLSSGSSINFGLGIDLINGGNDNNSLPSDGTYDLTITAESA